MKKTPFAELRRLLIDLGFRETRESKRVIFRHPTMADTWFVFRPYHADDPVASYNMLEVRNLLDQRGILPAEEFEDQVRKTPA